MSENMKEKLKEAGKKAEKATAEKRERTVKGAHLQTALVTLAKETGLNYIEKSGFAQVHGKRKGFKVYIALKGGRVDLSGFTLDHPAFTQITEEEAKAKHLGKVRATVNFDKSDDEVTAGYKAALAELLVEPPPEAPKPAKKKAETTEAAPAATESKGEASSAS